MTSLTDLIILYFTNVLTFLLFAYDKRQAIYKKERVSEFALILLTFLGGAFGALCAMIFFSHLTQHRTFRWCVPIAVTIQVAIPILLRTLAN